MSESLFWLTGTGAYHGRKAGVYTCILILFVFAAVVTKHWHKHWTEDIKSPSFVTPNGDRSPNGVTPFYVAGVAQLFILTSRLVIYSAVKENTDLGKRYFLAGLLVQFNAYL